MKTTPFVKRSGTDRRVVRVVMFGLLILCAVSLAHSQALFPGLTVQTGTAPRFAAIGDVSGDGKADLVTANAKANTVSVALNRGDGTFADKADYITDTTPACVVIADVNGDGKPDLVTANFGTNTVSVLLNNGNGTFAARKDYIVGTHPAAVAVADFNGDGKPDIVAANFNSNTVSFLPNTGIGAFGTKADIAVTSPEKLALADVNGDGKTDLLICSDFNSVISVFSGRGDGTFGVKVNYATGASPASVAVGDVNGDGKPDIVTGNFYGNTLSVLLNQDTGAAIAGKVTFEGIAANALPQNVTFQFRPVGGGSAITQTRKLNPDGAFAIMNVPAGNYTMWVKGEKYLASAVNVNTTSGNVPGLNILLHGGDGTNDNTVDVADFGLLVNSYLSSAAIADSNYDVRADFDGDGVIDINDFGLLVNNYNANGVP